MSKIRTLVNMNQIVPYSKWKNSPEGQAHLRQEQPPDLGRLCGLCGLPEFDIAHSYRDACKFVPAIIDPPFVISNATAPK